MKVLVTGGTGFVGRHLVKLLVRRGRDVVVLTRGETREPPSERGTDEGNVQYATWTPTRSGPWTNWIEDCDAVVHLAGAGIFDERWSPERLAVVRGSRVDSTRVLAEAIAAASRKPRVLVSASAIGYYGMRKDDEELAEDGPPGNDVLAEIVVAWEAAARAARDANVRVAHPRIGLVLGKDGGALEKLLPVFRAFVGGPIGDGKQWFSWIHVQDVVRALMYALDEDISGPFNATAPNPVRMNDLAKALGSELGRPSIFRVPAFALKLAVGAGAEALLTGPRVVPRALERAGFTFDFPDLASALHDLLKT